MYSNDQVRALCKELMKEMEGYINIMEGEMGKDAPNLAKISGALGKLSKVYGMICNFTGIWTDTDFREGGYKDVAKLMPKTHEVEDEEESES